MARQLLARLSGTAAVLLIVSLLVFALVHLVPGDPAITIAGEFATQEDIAEIRRELGLDKPVLVQYGDWLRQTMRGNFGQSLLTGRSVTSAITDRLPVTASLTAVALLFSWLISVPAGILAAVRRGGWLDRLLTLAASLGIAIPSFWLGLMLVVIFAINNPWLPATGYASLSDGWWTWLRHLVLPGLALAAVPAAETTRQLRSALANVLDQDYVQTARAKGLRPPKVIVKHALRNAAAPVITVVGLQVALLLGGSVIIEQVFNLPGLGQLVVQAVQDRDLPVIQGVVIITAIAIAVVNLLVDVSYPYFDPRLRRS